MDFETDAQNTKQKSNKSIGGGKTFEETVHAEDLDNLLASDTGDADVVVVDSNHTLTDRNKKIRECRKDLVPSKQKSYVYREPHCEYQLDEDFKDTSDIHPWQKNPEAALQKIRENCEEDITKQSEEIHKIEERIQRMNKNKKIKLADKRQALQKLRRDQSLRMNELRDLKKKLQSNNRQHLEYRSKLSVAGEIEYLRYVPGETTNDGKFFMERHYMAFCKMDQDPSREGKYTQHRLLEASFVEDNFHETMVEAIKAAEDNDGYIVMPKNARIEQFSKAVYDPTKKVFRLMREGNNKKTYEKSRDWMLSNFEEKYVNEVIDRSTRFDDHKFVRVPIGDTKDSKPSFQGVEESKSPNVHFQQGDKKLCALYSFSSVLAYTGHTKIAEELNHALQDREEMGSLSEIYAIADFLQTTKLKYLQPKIFKRKKLNILEDKKDYPTIVVLEGSDGSVSHAISTFGEWIFDANLQHAQKISKKILDWCVSSPDCPTEFRCVNIAIRFQKDPKSKKQLGEGFLV